MAQSPVIAIETGTFVSDGLTRNLSLPSGYTEFKLINVSSQGSAAATTPVMVATGTSLMPAGAAYYTPKTNGAATFGTTVTLATGGFTFVSDSSLVALGAVLSGTGAGTITNAAPPVVSVTSTAGLSTNGNVVRLSNSTGLLQLSGMDFSIGTVVTNTSFTLRYMRAPGTTATNVNARNVPFDPRYYPVRRFITRISLATSAIVTMSVTHGFTVGQAVRFIVPAEWGMTQMNGLLGTITAIGAADADGYTNTITVNINTSGFTAFAFPTSAQAGAGVNFAQVVPVGEGFTTVPNSANLLDDATRNVSFTGVQIGPTVQTSGETYQWIAIEGTTV